MCINIYVSTQERNLESHNHNLLNSDPRETEVEQTGDINYTDNNRGIIVMNRAEIDIRTSETFSLHGSVSTNLNS